MFERPATPADRFVSPYLNDNEARANNNGAYPPDLSVITKAKKDGVVIIKANYLPTKKNKPIEDFLPDCGFQKNEDDWVINVNNKFKSPDFIEIVDE